MEDVELGWQEAVSIAQQFVEECFRKLIQGDREALLGCYRDESIISWKGHQVNRVDVMNCYNSLRHHTLELISIDAQPIPDDPNIGDSGRIMVIASVVVSPNSLEVQPPYPVLATHTFILARDPRFGSEMPVRWIEMHIYR